MYNPSVRPSRSASKAVGGREHGDQIVLYRGGDKVRHERVLPTVPLGTQEFLVRMLEGEDAGCSPDPGIAHPSSPDGCSKCTLEQDHVTRFGSHSTSGFSLKTT